MEQDDATEIYVTEVRESNGELWLIVRLEDGHYGGAGISLGSDLVPAGQFQQIPDGWSQK